MVDSASEFNDWTLTLLSPLPGWAIVLIGLALVSALLSAWHGLRKEGRPWRRRLLLALRAGAVLVAAVLLLEPAVQLLQVRRVKNRIAVLLDTSASMMLPAGSGRATRLDLARSLLAGDTEYFRRLADRFVFEFATFDASVYPTDLAHLARIESASGKRTALWPALRWAASGSGPAGGRRLAGVLLLTDGADNDALASGLSPEVAEALSALGAPVHSFVAGDRDALKDVAVVRVLAEDFAFVRSAIEVEAVLYARGFGTQDLPITLRREGRVLSTKTVRLREGEETRVRFRFTPDTTGKFIYTIEAPTLAGEAVTTNNARSFVLKVIRDRIRVLQVVGRPSWDERFLRGLLKKDPNVDLISFFILRTPQDSTTVPQNDLSLIPFPTHELFTQELKTFDLVIFQNFDYLPYNMAQYLGNIRRYVEDGGAFVMVGGERAFSEGRYQGTYIEDILPVRLLPQGLGTIDESPFAPRLTPEGRRHPVTAGAQAALGGMPELHGINLVAAVKPEAQVLLEHPFLKTAGRNAPVVAAWEVGRGRVIAVMTDSTWFWSFPAAGLGGDRRFYDRFWTGAMRWLIRDPDLTNVHLRPLKDAFEPGEPIAVEVVVRDKEYGPAKGAKVVLEAYGPDGHRVAHETGHAGEDGVATFDLGPWEAGAFKLVAEAVAEGSDPQAPDTRLGREEGAVLVRASSVEWVDPAPRPELLRAIADASGGSVHALPRTTFPDLDFVDPEVVEVGRKKNVDLWDRWAWMALLLGLLGTEWALRRRWGHL
ncbi:MAG: hypothetical protein D6729_10885 [Deltaproteobacteria bacterium]|nr:MAG: hypothetical protein D6729_10885 [Deltaproteobacteria bacterium]